MVLIHTRFSVAQSACYHSLQENRTSILCSTGSKAHPMKPRGKRFTLLVGSLGLITILAAGLAVPGWFEAWYLRKLESEDETERVWAAEKLAEIKSVKAVPPLLQIAEAQYIEKQRGFEKHYCVKALVEIGEGAVPAVVEVLMEHKAASLAGAGKKVIQREFFALFLLREFGEKAKEAVPALIAVRDRSTKPIIIAERMASGAAQSALESIRGGERK